MQTLGANASRKRASSHWQEPARAVASCQCLLTPLRVTFVSGESAAGGSPRRRGSSERPRPPRHGRRAAHAAPAGSAGRLPWGLAPAAPEGRAASRGARGTPTGREQAAGRRAELAPLLPAPRYCCSAGRAACPGHPPRAQRAAGAPAAGSRGGRRESRGDGGRRSPPGGAPGRAAAARTPGGPLSAGSRLENRSGAGSRVPARGVEVEASPSTLHRRSARAPAFAASCPPSGPELAPGHTRQRAPLLPRACTRGGFRKRKAGDEREGKPRYRNTLLEKGQTNPGSAYFSCFAFSWMALSTPG